MSKKIPHRFQGVVFSLYMAICMAFLMCMAIVAISTGIKGGYWGRFIHAYIMAAPLAFGCLLVVRPMVVKLVGLTVEPPRAQ